MTLLSRQLIFIFSKNLFRGRDTVIRGRKFPLQRISGLRAYKIGNLMLIEQNPKKETQWAEMAKRGYKIAWIIDTRTNKYLYRIVNGKVEKL